VLCVGLTLTVGLVVDCVHDYMKVTYEYPTDTKSVFDLSQNDPRDLLSSWMNLFASEAFGATFMSLALNVPHDVCTRSWRDRTNVYSDSRNE
jgi:hypothetical protein